jgi:hypothetical protein
MAQKAGDKKTISLKFPFGGVHRRSAVQSQPPFTTPDALNTRPYDAIAQRLRGGSRPGLLKTHYTQLGSGNPVRMLNAVTIANTNDLTFWVDNFDAPAMSSVWTAASWLNGLPGILPDNYASVTYSTGALGAVRSALSDLDTSQAYVIEMFISPYNQKHQGTYQIFCRMDNSAPVATTAGVILELVMPDNSGVYSGSLKYYTGGVLTTNVLFTNGTTTVPQAGWFRVIISGNDISCYWLENQVLAATTVGAAAGARFGFSAHATQPANGGICLIDTFRIQYKTSNNNQAYRRMLVASSNGTLYKEEYLNTMTSVSSNLSLASDVYIQSAERFQKLYIADYGSPKRISTTGSVSGGVLDDANVSDWTALGLNIYDYMVEITAVTGATGDFPTNGGSFPFSVIHATNGLTLTGTTGGAASCTYRVSRCPKIYDPIANTLTKWVPTAGYIELECPLVTCYRDRMVLAGPPTAPHAWFMSRAGDPLDFDYGARDTDTGRAVAGVDTESGLLGEPIKALIQAGDTFLIFGCENSMWLLEQDPTYNGQLRNISRTIGVVDKKAWCFGPNNEIIFLSRDGLYILQPGGQGNPQSVSREKLPEELLRLDNTQNYIQLQYDVQDRGVHIFIVPKDGNGQYSWWLDWETKSFWPVSFGGTSLSAQFYNLDPTQSVYHAATCARDTAVILGCRDGYLRRFSNASDICTDDNQRFHAYVDYGPIQMGDLVREGILAELVGMLGRGTSPLGVGGIQYQIFVGETAEAARVNTTAFKNDATAYFYWALDGLNYNARPRARGAYFKLRVGILPANAGPRWAIESITATIEKVGVQRL